jgi:hypothetical protein
MKIKNKTHLNEDICQKILNRSKNTTEEQFQNLNDLSKMLLEAVNINNQN